jgi:hypothetical protein
MVFAFSIRLVMAYMLFQLDIPKVRGLMKDDSHFDIKVLRKSFIDEILTLELNSDNSLVVIKWAEKHFNFSFDLNEENLMYFEQFGMRFNFLMSISTEIILNAVKYSKPDVPIEIIWNYDLRQFIFQCSNSIDDGSQGKFQGAGRGLDFIKGIVNNFNKSSLTIKNIDGVNHDVILRIQN